MDEYTRLKTKLEDYLALPDVELSDTEISIYQLKQIVDQKLTELRNIQLNPNFKDEINKSRTTIQKIGGIFKKKQAVCEKPCTCVMFSCNGKKSEITFGFSNPRVKLGTDFLRVCKDVDSDQIYFGEYNSDKEFVEKHYDRISEYFSILEEFSRLYQGGVGNCGKNIYQVIDDGFFYITLTCDTYGRTSILTSLTAEEDKEKMYHREWLQRPTLKDIYQENEEDFLKKIPVSIDSLNHTFKTIVRDAISKVNVPQLVKRK